MADFHDFDHHVRGLFEVFGDEQEVGFVVRRAGMGVQVQDDPAVGALDGGAVLQ